MYERQELSRAKDFHVIFMDCQMPDMDGYEATRAIRLQEGNARHTPIVATTAHAMQGDRERCLGHGMDDYLTKPLRADDLVGALRHWAPSTQRSEPEAQTATSSGSP